MNQNFYNFFFFAKVVIIICFSWDYLVTFFRAVSGVDPPGIKTWCLERNTVFVYR